MIQTEYNTLKEQGYCSVFADFNGLKGMMAREFLTTNRILIGMVN